MKGWSSVRGLPREVWVLFTATLVNRAGTMAVPFLVLYLTRHLGFSVPRAGFVLALFGIAALVAGPISGRVCDRVGPRRVMVASLLVSGVFMVLYPLARTYSAVVVLTVLWAFVGELFRPASLAILTDLVAPEKRKAVFALNRLAINLGMSMGPAVGGFLARASFPLLFVTNGTTAILAGLVLLLSRWQVAPPEHAAGAHAATRGGLFDRRLLYFLAAMFPVIVVFFQHESAMSLFLVERLGFPETFYGLLFTLNTLLIVALEVPLNAATAHWPHRRALALGSLLVGAGFGLLAVARSGPAVALTVVIWTFGEMTLLPSLAAYVADVAPPGRRGEYMGLYTMTFSGGFAVGPWLGTLVLAKHGPHVLWGGVFLLAALSALLFTRVDETAPAAVPPVLSASTLVDGDAGPGPDTARPRAGAGK